jgi:arylsulfatase
MNGIYTDYKEMLKQKEDIGTWKSYNHYPVGWAHAMNTPMQWCKQIASHYGGTRNGLVISWPKGIKDVGGIRSQWHHVIDIFPTILEATQIQAPSSVNGTTQKPMEGVSMEYTFDKPKEPSRHRTQYFELFGNRAIYDDGWIASTTPVGLPWVSEAPTVDVINGYKWELYHVDEDFTQANNLADKNPDKLKELQLLFYSEAAKYNVLPLDDSRTSRLNPAIRPSLTLGRTSFTYYQGMKRLPEGVAPDIKNKSWTITAKINISKNETEGILATMGGLFDGWALYLEKGKPVFHYNYGNVIHTNIASSEVLKSGDHTITFDFKYDGGGLGKGGLGTLTVDGKKAAEKRIEKTIFNRFTLDETFDIGEDTGTPVNLNYDVPYAFTGKIEKVIISLEENKAPAKANNKK